MTPRTRGVCAGAATVGIGMAEGGFGIMFDAGGGVGMPGGGGTTVAGGGWPEDAGASSA